MIGFPPQGGDQVGHRGGVTHRHNLIHTLAPSPLPVEVSAEAVPHDQVEHGSERQGQHHITTSQAELREVRNHRHANEQCY